jgi:uncharacterized protein (TIGR03905 family)
MEYIYKTKNTCSTQIKFDMKENVITNVDFTGGCDGNLKAISNLIDGWTVEQIEGKCKGNTCGGRPTSCVDQLALAVRQALNKNK